MKARQKKNEKTFSEYDRSEVEHINVDEIQAVEDDFWQSMEQGRKYIVSETATMNNQNVSIFASSGFSP